MVRVGIASFAHMHAMSYAGALKRLPGVEFIGIMDDDKERGTRIASVLGVKYHATPESFFDAKPHGVVVCSENARHLHWVEMAARHGASVLCEKPIATNMEDAWRMLEACASNGVKLQMAFPCRFHTAAVRTRQILESGQLGKVFAIKATNHGTMPGGWFADPELAGGGAVIDHTVHVVDLIRWMFSAEVKSVYAEIGKLFHDDIVVDDAGLLSLKFGNGIVATLDASWSRPRSFPTWGDVTMEIVGTEGTLEMDMFAQKYALYTDADNRCHWEDWGDDMDEGLVASFVTMLETGSDPVVTGLDGLKATQVALAAYTSAKEGRPIYIA